ncbi:MAG TPA: glycosyltransferase family 4 protein [Elusimicrobiales bacterium]|nr:glycosyltransferase family 4 protein [Elusimicrobiales bacterium]
MKLKICMLIARFAPVKGGMEMQTLRLSKALIAREHDVFVVTARLKGLRPYEEYGKLPVHRTFAYGSGIISSLFFCLSSFIFLIKNRARFDIIHIQLASSHAVTGIIAAKLLRKKFVLQLGASREYGDVGTSGKTLVGRLKLRFIRRFTGLFLVLNDEMVRELLDIGIPDEKIVKIPIGVDVNEYKPVDGAEKERLKTALKLPFKKIVIFIARLEPQKAADNLLKAWKMVRSAGKDVNLVIAGGGCQEGYLKKLSTELGLDDSVTFVGPVENTAVYLQASDIFVLPSLAEGLAIILLEAMSAAKPIVATRVGGTDELIRNNFNGLTVEPGNVEALAEGISKLLNDPELSAALAGQARGTIINGYSLEAATSICEDVYKTRI